MLVSFPGIAVSFLHELGVWGRFQKGNRGKGESRSEHFVRGTGGPKTQPGVYFPLYLSPGGLILPGQVMGCSLHRSLHFFSSLFTSLDGIQAGLVEDRGSADHFR